LIISINIKSELQIENEQHMAEQWMLSHGLSLDESVIQPSNQAVLTNDGELDISLHEGEPIIYTNTTDTDTTKNFITFDNNIVILNNTLKQSDICINFPIVEITYKGEPLDSFMNDEEENLHDKYGHILANEFLAGGQLFIKNFNLASSKQIEILKFYLIWAYNSVKNNDEIEFNNNSFELRFLQDSNGEDIKTPKELADWMKNLYQENTIEIISYKNFNDIFQLKNSNRIPKDFENQPGIKKSSLTEWEKNSTLYIKLTKWIKDFNLLQGLVICKSNKIENSKKVAIDITGVPKVNDLNDHPYFEIINPATKLEENLIYKNIFSIKNTKSLPFPFIKTNDVVDKDNIHLNIHLVVKCERYEILISRDDIKPSKKFNNAIEEALNSMKPFNYLQDVFKEYGHLFPLRIIIGKSLQNIAFFDTFEKVNLKLPIKSKLPTESLQSYLKNLNISSLLTQGGNIIKESNLDNWIQNTDDELEVIELDEIISLYDVLELEQKRKIDIILNNNNQDNYKIILTGITDLKYLNNSDDEHYMKIKTNEKLTNENYEVFGSIISKNTKNNLKIEDYFIKFGFYSVNGFSVVIKNLEKESIDITECFILWMIIGNPLKLSVFSPHNREFQVNCIKKSITLQPEESMYNIEIPFTLYQGYTILINVSTSNNIVKLVEWSHSSINLKLIKSTHNDSETDTNIDLDICILCSSTMINYGKEKYPLDLIGYILTKENFIDNKFDINPYIDDDISKGN
jgi:hypothetical protein